MWVEDKFNIKETLTDNEVANAPHGKTDPNITTKDRTWGYHATLNNFIFFSFQKSILQIFWQFIILRGIMSCLPLNALKDKTNYLLIYFHRKWEQTRPETSFFYFYTAVISVYTVRFKNCSGGKAGPSRWGELICLWIYINGTPPATIWNRFMHLSKLIHWAERISAYLCMI